mmetsp:Transcript_41002/g.68115  ORF Transcript_41002/g.68115 Transcript_41002/m.68115 type:complete len:257 (-) Transcript_41002:218-988(-)
MVSVARQPPPDMPVRLPSVTKRIPSPSRRANRLTGVLPRQTLEAVTPTIVPRPTPKTKTSSRPKESEENTEASASSNSTTNEKAMPKATTAATEFNPDAASSTVGMPFALPYPKLENSIKSGTVTAGLTSAIRKPSNAPQLQLSVPDAQLINVIAPASMIMGTTDSNAVTPRSRQSLAKSNPSPARVIMIARATSRTFELSRALMPDSAPTARRVKPHSSMPASAGSPSRVAALPAIVQLKRRIAKSHTAPPGTPA